MEAQTLLNFCQVFTNKQFTMPIFHCTITQSVPRKLRQYKPSNVYFYYIVNKRIGTRFIDEIHLPHFLGIVCYYILAFSQGCGFYKSIYFLFLHTKYVTVVAKHIGIVSNFFSDFFSDAKQLKSVTNS